MIRLDFRDYISECEALEFFEPKNPHKTDEECIKNADERGVTLIGYE